jgi:hypothetical protein
MTGKELSPVEAKFWKEELRAYSEKEIDSAFREHLRRNKYFPALAQILDLIREESRKQTSWTYTGPAQTDEDRRRKAAGWRQYGVPDVKCYGELRHDYAAKVGRKNLTSTEIETVLADMDKRIDLQEKARHDAHSR